MEYINKEFRDHVDDEERKVLLTFCLKVEGEEVINTIEVNNVFMSHLKRNPLEIEAFICEFSQAMRGMVEDAK